MVKKLNTSLKNEIEKALKNEPRWVIDLTIKDWERYLAGKIKAHYYPEEIAPPQPEDIDDINNTNKKNLEEWIRLGKKAIGAGEVAVYLGEAGQATNFGSCTKAIVEVRDDKTFHELKLDNVKQMQKEYEVIIPVFKFVSEITAKDIAALEKKKALLKDITAFEVIQHQTLRAETVAGGGLQIARTLSGEIDYAMGGHWYIFPEFREQGLAKAKELGIKYVFFSNIDNLGATLEPLLIGYHIWKKNEMTMEVAEKHEGDKGGAGARIKGHFGLLEAPRVPSEWKERFNGAGIFKYFNTNTFVLSLSAFECKDIPELMIIRKKINDKEKIIFERISGEMTQFLRSSILATDRNVRFNPSKYIADLWLQRSDWCVLENAKVVPAKDERKNYIKKPFLAVSKRILGSITDLDERIAAGGRNTSLKNVEKLVIGGAGDQFDQLGDMRVGNNVVFKGTVEIIFEGPNSDLIISDNAVIENQKIVIPEGEHKII